MNKIIIDVLNKIEESGYEAYIVGGYVRDHILNIESKDIDICTNAKVVQLMELLKEYKPVSNNYGSIKFSINNYKFDITTYRKELNYNSHKNIEIIYVDNLVEDITRRDFTCNTLCMGTNGEIIDLLNGQEDTLNRIIKSVGDSDTKIKQDPLRILRAIRFATCLDFKIEPYLYESIKKYASLTKELSMTRIKEELNKILTNKNAAKGLEYLRQLNILEYIGINYTKVNFVTDICGMYSQLEFTKEYPFSKEEKENIKNIKNIVKYGKIDKEILFDYGLYISLVAGSILNIDKEIINDMHKDMKIYKLKDINITSKEICDILKTEPSKIIKDVYNHFKTLILEDKIDNDNEKLKEYLYINREKLTK